jgi:nitrogen fixation NifU-like protein
VSDFEELYQEIILDHARSPRGAARLDHLPDSAIFENPLCGDSIKVEVSLADAQGGAEAGPPRAADGANKIAGSRVSVRFEAKGCAISTASASLMCLAMEGLTPLSARDLAQRFIEALRGERPLDSLDAMGDLVALKGVARFPARVKCATLAWHALLSALPPA